MHTGSVNEQVVDSPDDLNKHLENFGVPRRSLSDRVKPAVALMGYDPERIDLEAQFGIGGAYAWVAGG